MALDVAAVYRMYGHSVLRRARQILASPDEAADVLQEVFTGLVEDPGQFGQRSSISTFLYVVTTRACLQRLRARKNRLRLLDEQVRPWATDVDARAPDATSILRDVLAQLPEDEARAAVFFHLDGMTHAEIADVLGCSRRHVGNLLDRVSKLIPKEMAS